MACNTTQPGWTQTERNLRDGTRGAEIDTRGGTWGGPTGLMPVSVADMLALWAALDAERAEINEMLTAAERSLAGGGAVHRLFSKKCGCARCRIKRWQKRPRPT